MGGNLTMLPLVFLSGQTERFAKEKLIGTAYILTFYKENLLKWSQPFPPFILK